MTMFRAAALALALAAPLAAQTAAPIRVPVLITKALADPSRPAADRERDAARRPGELIAFAGIGSGATVADFMMGSGYFTRILAKVVGPHGHVYAYQANEFIAFRAAYATEQDEALKGFNNASASRSSLAKVHFPEPLDAIITVQNWHDLHLKFAGPDLAATVAQRLHDALKPGGILLVVDHVANADPEMTAPDTLHRIDPASVRAEIEKAGFKLVGETAILRNPNDPHTAIVFDPSIRGKTDQFVYKFKRVK